MSFWFRFLPSRRLALGIPRSIIPIYSCPPASFASSGSVGWVFRLFPAVVFDWGLSEVFLGFDCLLWFALFCTCFQGSFFLGFASKSLLFRVWLVMARGSDSVSTPPPTRAYDRVVFLQIPQIPRIGRLPLAPPLALEVYRCK